MTTIDMAWDDAFKKLYFGDRSRLELLLLINAPKDYLFRAVKQRMRKWLFEATTQYAELGYWMDEPYKLKPGRESDCVKEWYYARLPFGYVLEPYFCPLYGRNPIEVYDYALLRVLSFIGVELTGTGTQLELFTNQLNLNLL